MRSPLLAATRDTIPSSIDQSQRGVVTDGSQFRRTRQPGGPSLEAIESKLRALTETEIGVNFIYAALEILAQTYTLVDAVIVLESHTMGTQIFRMGNLSIGADFVARFGSRPGVYCQPNIVPRRERDAVYRACQRWLSTLVPPTTSNTKSASITATRHDDPVPAALALPDLARTGDVARSLIARFLDVSRNADVRFTEVRMRASLSAVLIAVDVVAALMALAGFHGPARVAFGLAFALLTPGWAIVGPLRLRNPPLEFGLTVSVSLAVLMIIAQMLATFHLWDLTTCEVIIAAASLPSLVWQVGALLRLPRPSSS